MRSLTVVFDKAYLVWAAAWQWRLEYFVFRRVVTESLGRQKAGVYHIRFAHNASLH